MDGCSEMALLIWVIFLSLLAYTSSINQFINLSPIYQSPRLEPDMQAVRFVSSGTTGLYVHRLNMVVIDRFLHIYSYTNSRSLIHDTLKLWP
ncbi:hypothetical protein F5Y12DRAFT_734328 [Xylaria sp. FL1777]|nr:hypothetical protein F5Y12DRAFT_734328 [Xylaria sp. FL1777]